MEYHFLQGKKNLLEEGMDSEKALETIKDKIGSFFDIKNLFFLFGSGTSAKAVPLMKGLYDGLQTEKEAYSEEEKAFLGNISDSGNIENVLGVLYSGRGYLTDRKNLSEKETKSLETVNSLIEKIETYLKSQIDVLNTDEWDEKTRETGSSYHG